MTFEYLVICINRYKRSAYRLMAKILITINTYFWSQSNFYRLRCPSVRYSSQPAEYLSRLGALFGWTRNILYQLAYLISNFRNIPWIYLYVQALAAPQLQVKNN